MQVSEVVSDSRLVVVMVEDGIVQRVYMNRSDVQVVVVDKDVHDEESAASVWSPMEFRLGEMELSKDTWGELARRFG